MTDSDTKVRIRNFKKYASPQAARMQESGKSIRGVGPVEDIVELKAFQYESLTIKMEQIVSAGALRADPSHAAADLRRAATPR